jgi:hypothetical protein
MIETILATILLAQSVGSGYDPGSTNRYAPSPLIACTNDKSPNAYINLRKGPSTNHSVIAKLSRGHGIEQDVHRVVGSDGFPWDFVITVDRKRGWIRNDYVCVN